MVPTFHQFYVFIELLENSIISLSRNILRDSYAFKGKEIGGRINRFLKTKISQLDWGGVMARESLASHNGTEQSVDEMMTGRKLLDGCGFYIVIEITAEEDDRGHGLVMRNKFRI